MLQFLAISVNGVIIMPPFDNDNQRRFLGISPILHQPMTLSYGLLLLSLVGSLFLPWPRVGLALAVVTLILCPISKPFIALVLGFLLAAYWGVDWEQAQLPEQCLRHEADVAGQIVDFPTTEYFVSRDQPRQQFMLKIMKIEPSLCDGPRRLSVSLWRAEPQLALGDYVTARVRLLPPRSQWNTGSLPDQVRNVVAGIDGRATVIPASVQVQKAESGLDRVHVLRRRLTEAINKMPGSARATALLAALVVGDDNNISKSDWQRFQRLGVAHVLVISGLHVGLIFLLVWGLAKRLGSFLPNAMVLHDISGLIALFAAAGYALLAGLSLPTQRALWMLSVWVLTRSIGWHVPASRVLLFAVTLLLIVDPFAVLGRSFWLSVGATATLIFCGRIFRARMEQGLIGTLSGLLGTQLIMVLLMAPVTLFWLGQLSVAGILCNVVLVPPVAIFLIPSALLGGCWQLLLPGMSNPFWWFALRGLELLLPLLSAVDHVLGTVSTVTPPMIFKASVLGASLTVLDVDQGTAAVWEEAGHILVYDTGAGVPGGYSQADKVLMPWLRNRGISSIDALVVSHADTDHSGGRVALIEQINIDKEFGPWGSSCRPGQRLDWPGETVITMLNGHLDSDNDDNTGSCVLLLEYRDRRILMTGDIPLERERELVRYWRHRLQSDVLLVGHHGSQTSTGWSFLKWVQPEWAIITAGRANRFGHPDQDVVSRLGTIGAQTLNTAVTGAITVTIAPSGELNVSWLRRGSFPYWLALP